MKIVKKNTEEKRRHEIENEIRELTTTKYVIRGEGQIRE